MKARVIKEWEMYGITHKVGEVMTISLHSPGGLPMISDRDAFLLDNGFIEEIKEPLIKDAGARDVMRLWAKVNHIPTNATTIEYHYAESLCGTESEFWDNDLHIMFYGKIAPNAVHGKIYTIDELCGEEEE